MKLHYLRIKSSPQSSQEARKALKPLLGKEVELMIGRISAKNGTYNQKYNLCSLFGKFMQKGCIFLLKDSEIDLK